MYFLDSIHAVYWKGHWAVYVWYSAACAVVAMLIIAIALSGSLPRLLFENPIAMFLGTISYSLYLWHFPVGAALARALDAPSMGLAKFTLAALPPIVAVSALSYYWVERRWMRPP
jgi:peptidoglycan/LPS O-acetylase OafA/YrhL